MTIINRIRAFQLAVGLAAILMAVVVYLNVHSTTYYFERVQLSRQQLDATVELALHANRFSEQIAELLLIGEPERPDFESARNQTAAALAQLRRITREEIEFVQESSELEEELREVDRLDRMQVLFLEIDRAVERVLLLDQQGRRDEAVALFRSDIENRLDAEFEELIAEAVDDERSEAISAGSVAIDYLERLLIGTLTLTAVLLAIAIVSGFLLARSLRVPLKALTEGAIAIERGDLDRRIAYSKRDEFGLVAQRFNSMADELRRWTGDRHRAPRSRMPRFRLYDLGLRSRVMDPDAECRMLCGIRLGRSFVPPSLRLWNWRGRQHLPSSFSTGCCQTSMGFRFAGRCGKREAKFPS